MLFETNIFLFEINVVLYINYITILSVILIPTSPWELVAYRKGSREENILFL